MHSGLARRNITFETEAACSDLGTRAGTTQIAHTNCKKCNSGRFILTGPTRENNWT